MVRKQATQLIVKKTHVTEDERVSNWLGVLNERTMSIIEYIGWCQRNGKFAYARDILDFVAPEIRKEKWPALPDYLLQRDSFVEVGYIANINEMPAWYDGIWDAPFEYLGEVDAAYRITPTKLDAVARILKI